MHHTNKTILVSGGAGYIGSHVVHALKQAGFKTIVADNLINGNRWAADKADVFVQTDIGDAEKIADICKTHHPVAALHFAAFIEVGESVQKPEKYFTNNRDKAKIFFDTLAANGVENIVFSSTAAVYGDVKGDTAIDENTPCAPINPYGQAKYEAESYLRTLSNVRSVTLRYFNVAGAAPGVGLGEAHTPETHLIPRIVLPLIDAPQEIQKRLNLASGFKVFGTDYPTRDGTAVRDYIHVMDLADAHIRALTYLLDGGQTNIFNLGSGSGYSVSEIVNAARTALNRSDFTPGTESRRAGDPPTLVADSTKARSVLGWTPSRDVTTMIADAAAWHKQQIYVETILEKTTATD